MFNLSTLADVSRMLVSYAADLVSYKRLTSNCCMCTICHTHFIECDITFLHKVFFILVQSPKSTFAMCLAGGVWDESLVILTLVCLGNSFMVMTKLFVQG